MRQSKASPFGARGSCIVICHSKLGLTHEHIMLLYVYTSHAAEITTDDKAPKRQ